METRNVKISLETATRWHNGNDEELKQLAIHTYPELKNPKLPNSWYDLKNISGFYTDKYSATLKSEGIYTTDENRNVFATENQAKSALAMAKLSQVMAVYNDGWVADWSDLRQDKYCICIKDKKIQVLLYFGIKHFLAFKTKELAKEFLEIFREDIETYYNF
jgi:hypothetical protein